MRSDSGTLTAKSVKVNDISRLVSSADTTATVVNLKNSKFQSFGSQLPLRICLRQLTTPVTIRPSMLAIDSPHTFAQNAVENRMARSGHD